MSALQYIHFSVVVGLAVLALALAVDQDPKSEPLFAALVGALTGALGLWWVETL